MPRTELHTDRAHPARVYDCILGGKTHFAADRQAAAAMLQDWPDLVTSMRANRAFMHRVARWLARRGLDQFLDIGTGIPTSPNLHEVVQGTRPTARIAYLDNDPIVLAHARALLRGTPDGHVDYLSADLRDLPGLLSDQERRQLFDWSRPLAVLALAVLQFVTDNDARTLLHALVQEIPSRSYLAVSLPTADTAGSAAEHVADRYAAAGIPVVMRTAAEVADLLVSSGLDLAPPGVALVHRWHPELGTSLEADTTVAMYGAVAIKP
ncbi:hypothetical protein BIV57_03920 [Mangrovactinospora gilvigrisea]|uniref:Methyltransferase n=1 Tax=Mangrovactinospora gilvigrisea TaxID=1428644 RepID=A0A1J7BJD1_9ACTN|nr:hypothetical protein BIV57_03920 [Mangrovactinospora gilvigrisea]